MTTTSSVRETFLKNERKGKTFSVFSTSLSCKLTLKPQNTNKAYCVSVFICLSLIRAKSIVEGGQKYLLINAVRILPLALCVQRECCGILLTFVETL